MGQKINPTGFRLPVTRNWTSRWYAVGRDFSRTLGEDLAVRSFLLKKLRNASVSRILIERPANNARITIFSARPGIVIGKQGADIEALKAEVQKMMGVPVHVNIEEVRRPELDAQLIADGITQQLEKRVMFRRAMKRRSWQMLLPQSGDFFAGTYWRMKASVAASAAAVLTALWRQRSSSPLLP